MKGDRIMKWFKDISTLDHLRKRYKQLVVQHHPDNGGSDDAIKEINSEYDILFKKLKNSYEHSESYQRSSDRQKQSYDSVKDQKIREMIVKLSRLQGLVIELCGVWLWVSGDTKRYKDELKALGLHYASQKKCWYIHFDDYVKHGTKSSSMSHIRSKYGSMVINTRHDEKELSAKTGG